jgi:hypothetical protein
LRHTVFRLNLTGATRRMFMISVCFRLCALRFSVVNPPCPPIGYISFFMVPSRFSP